MLTLNAAIVPLMELRAVFYRCANIPISERFLGVVDAALACAVDFREQAARAYPAWMYGVSLGIIEIPYTCLISIIPMLIFYFMVPASSAISA